MIVYSDNPNVTCSTIHPVRTVASGSVCHGEQHRVRQVPDPYPREPAQQHGADNITKTQFFKHIYHLLHLQMSTVSRRNPLRSRTLRTGAM
jgi:hypothetical protein